MIKYLLIIIVLIGMGVIFYPLVNANSMNRDMSMLSQEYIVRSASELNIPNVVTGIVVTFRGLDTLGEVTVLFLATAGVGFLLKKKEIRDCCKRDGSEIIKTASSMLTPIIILFGIYIFIHGHLTPGGGFQGGVVIASAFLLLIMAFAGFKMSHLLIHLTESLSGFTYVLIGTVGLVLFGINHFLNPLWLQPGTWGNLISGSAIPIIYSLIGIKVGAEMSSLLDSLKMEEDE